MLTHIATHPKVLPKALPKSLVMGFITGLIALSCGQEVVPSADVRRVTTRADLVGGPSALGELGDFVLENDRVKVVIQDKGYSRGFGVYGGGLIDADLKRPIAPGTSDGGEGRDSFGELFPIYFLQALNPDTVEVVNEPAEDGSARVRVSGLGGEFLSITQVLNRALVNSYEGTDGFPDLPSLLGALGEGLDALIKDKAPRMRFELIYSLAPNTSHVVIESAMINEDPNEQDIQIPSDVARRLFGLPNFAGIARDPFRVPLGFVALFGAGNQVFAPGFGFDIRFSLEDRYALSGEATAEKEAAKDSGEPLTAAQDKTLALPELPGLITPGLISVNPEGNSYGLFMLPERVEPTEEEPSEYPKSFVYNQLEPLKPDQEDSPEAARNVYSKLFGDEVGPGDALIPFSASSFTGMLSGRAPALLPYGERYSVKHAFIIGEGDVSSVMDVYYELMEVKTAPVVGEVLDQVTGAPVEGASVVFYDADERPINQSFSDEQGRLTLTLPPGRYLARVQDHPTIGPMSAFEVSAEEGASLRLTRLTPARISVNVRGEDALPLPAKLTVVGFVSDASKAGVPLKEHLFDLASGEAWRTDDLTPDNPSDPSTMRYIEGSSVTHEGAASLEVPPGRYEVYISRGTEYELKRVDVEVKAGEVFPYSVTLKREVITEGYVSADFHLHAAPSLDSDLPLRRRVRTAAAEGLEHLVATDHNFVTDYQPFIEREGLTQWLSSMIGLELTTLEAGHFNTFPIDRDKAEITRGSFEWSNIPPAQVFERARAAGEAPIIQVNHPRDQLLGYFSQYGLNALTASVPEPVEGGGSLLDVLGQLIAPSGPAFFDEEGVNQYSGAFDAIEVLNHGLFHEEFHARMPEQLDPNKEYGASGGLTREELEAIPAGAILCEGDEVAYPGAIDDWFNLLNLGERPAGTANSDSHHGDDIGYPRTYVRVGTDNPSVVRSADVARAVHDRALTMSRGPFLELFVNGQPVGSEVVAEGGEVEVRLRVQAPRWVEVNKALLYVNGEPFRQLSVEMGDETSFEWSERIALPRDAWLVAQASGERSMFPVAPPIDLPPMLLNEAFGAIAGPLGLGGGDLTELAPAMTGVFTPFALTNPIWVDVDGGGFEAPGLPMRACNGLFVEELGDTSSPKRLEWGAEGLPQPGAQPQAQPLPTDPSLRRRAERARLRRNRETLSRSFGFPRLKGDIKDVRVIFESHASHSHVGE